MNQTTASAEQLRSEIQRLGPWHQDLEIAPGVRTGVHPPGVTDPLRVGSPGLIEPKLMIDHLLRDFLPGGFAGRSVLDCACNAGGYLFEARNRGAGHCFGFDVRDHWIQQARFLAQYLPSEDIGFSQSDLLDLRQLQLPIFDVTFFFGIFYHLPDPAAALRIAADHTRELLVVNTAADIQRSKHALTLSMESDTMLMSGVHQLAWMPTSPHVVEAIIRWCGFPHTRVHYIRKPLVKQHRYRMQILGARDARTFAHFDSIQPPPPLWKRVARRLLN
jgi:tRNA (mo5U34)-methyltransferase